MSGNQHYGEDIEARLRSTEERFRLAEAASGVGTFEVDLASNRWECTTQVGVLFGLDPRNSKPSFSDLERAIFVDDAPKLRAAIEAATRTGILQVEIRVKHSDGSIHWLAGKGEIRPDQNDPAGRLWGAYYEITERKTLEARLLAFNETLEARLAERAQKLSTSVTKALETERQFRLLVESVTDYAIFMLDPEGRVVNWNAGAERIKGYAPEEIIGKHYSQFYTEQDRQRGLPQEVITTAKRVGRYESEGWRVRKDGSRFWANVMVSAIRGPGGELLGFSKVTRDLTERQAAEERMRHAQKMEAIGQLTGGVAHDFNNLLTVICGNIEALQRRLPDGMDDLRRLVSGALRGAERAAILTHRLLAFARRQTLDPRSLSVNTVINGLSEMLRRTLGESIHVEVVLAGGVWPVLADPNELESAVLNLSVNARDAMPDGGKLTIEAGNVYLDEAYAAQAEIPPGQYVGVFVSDTGTGMTSETASRAFEPFFTTKDIGQGTGLGLSQVYGFIKQSGGHVKIYSELGAGTTIKLYLPRHVLAENVGRAPTAVGSVPRGNGETILVVEDDPDVRSFTIELLQELGYQTIDAPDGAAALRLLETRGDVRMLFTDVGLPHGMNGRQLANEAQRRRTGLKVLFTSGYARNAIVHHGRLDPGVELITKPFTYSGLGVKIRRILDAQ
jgi:PAS domain S-box-containing protein